MAEAVNPPSANVKGKQAEAMFSTLVREGKIVPWREVYVARAGDTGSLKGAFKPVPSKKGPAQRTIAPKLLGDAEIGTDAPDDLRGILMTWLRRPDNPYFAKAFVNRVWAAYFNVGIIEPPDDLSLANPPSNAALLDYLTRGFIEHGYDMRWLHREIASSRTYQLSWKPNETNRLDTHNFSHALPRRLPAEVAYDAIFQATAATEEVAAWQREASQRSIGVGSAASGKARGKFGNILTVFGKPDRLANCDCERSNDPSLLQTLFLLNDGEIQALLSRPGGWVSQVAREFSPPAKPMKGALAAGVKGKRETAPAEDAAARAKTIAKLERRIQELRESGNNDEAAKLKQTLLGLKQSAPAAEPKRRTITPEEEQKLVREAFLRTVCRVPTEKEIALARDYFKESASLDAGVRDLLWALINTNEFLLNH